MKAAKALEEAMRRDDKPIPPDWFTVAEYAAAKGISPVHASHVLTEGARKGVLDTQKWKRRDRWVNLFRTKTNPPPSVKASRGRREGYPRERTAGKVG